MAIFTAIATAIVGAIGVTGVVATVATSVIAAGLALGTAKILGITKAPQNAFRASSQAANDPGVRIQLPPATDNKIPIFYGNVVTSGIVTHANISVDNQTMTYVLVLSEKLDSAANYSVNKIYRNDETLTIDNSGIVTLATDADLNVDANINGKMRVHIFAGNANSNVNQVYPTTNKVAANSLATVLSDDGASMEDLVYAVISMDYDAGNNLTTLGTISFDIANDLTNPANVLYDYLSSSRYGAGLTAGTDFDTVSLADVFDYANAQVDYTPWDDTDQPQSQWRIDGVLSTYVAVKENIDKICQSCATWFTYSPKLGKFKFVPNRAATISEKANAFVFTDDNIVSGFDITSTELYSLFNIIEAEHPQYNQKDQTDVVHLAIPSGARNPNEPDNALNIRYDLVNDNSRVQNLANIDLRQSRYGTVVSFVADYSALTCEAGDVVKLTNTVYGYDEDLFRVITVDEQEGSDGTLTCKIVLLEYNDAIYDHEIVLQKSPPLPNGVPNSKNNAETQQLNYEAIANAAVNGFANSVIMARVINIPDLVAQEEFTNITNNVAIIQSDVSNIELEIANIEVALANVDLANLIITETNIAANAITTPKIATNAVVARHILAGEIIAEKIGALAVTTAKLDALAVTAEKINSLAVTTAKLDALAVTGEKIAANTITANKIQVGSVSVDRLESGTFATTLGLTFGLGAGSNVNGYFGTVVGASTDGNTAAGIFAATNQSSLLSGVTVGTSKYAIGGYAGFAANFTPGSWTVVGTLGFDNGIGSQAAGYFANDDTGDTLTLCTESYALYTDGNAYIGGTTYPFTGAHISIISNAESPEPGDILVDSSMVVKTGISQTTSLVTLSNTAEQAGVIGVYVGDRADYPSTMVEWVYPEGADPNMGYPKTPVLKSEYSNLMSTHHTVGLNALGEGQINVCGENGNIALGDLIVTSSTLGKGMRQGDDIIRSITVAKAREPATFNTAAEVKQIACVYLAG